MAQDGTRARLWWCLVAAALASAGCPSHRAGSDGGGPQTGKDAGKDAGRDAGKDTGTDKRPTFSARLSGATVVVDVASGTRLWFRSCSDSIVLEKRVGSTWEAPQDDRPSPADSHGYYLDDEFVPLAFNLGCDVINCLALGPTTTVGPTEEYVATGTLRAPPVEQPMGSGPPPPTPWGTDPVPVIERRSLHGELRVRLQYSEDPACRTAFHEATAELTVPEQGVCCPIGRTGCSSHGPGGGWAPTLDACPVWNTLYDRAYARKTDLRGCPVLMRDLNSQCAPGADAGL
jgi:hypothetical protein